VQLSEAKAAVDISNQQFEGLKSEKYQREQREKQNQDRYQSLSDETLKQMDINKVEWADKQM